LAVPRASNNLSSTGFFIIASGAVQSQLQSLEGSSSIAAGQLDHQPLMSRISR